MAKILLAKTELNQVEVIKRNLDELLGIKHILIDHAKKSVLRSPTCILFSQPISLVSISEVK